MSGRCSGKNRSRVLTHQRGFTFLVGGLRVSVIDDTPVVLA
jgi:hypothetical protein